MAENGTQNQQAAQNQQAQNQATNQAQNQAQNQQAQHGNAGTAVDYQKIQQMLDGTLKAKEETALKAYFKQQGLSQEEAEQAMADFKSQKAAKTPNIEDMQTQIASANASAQKARLESAATLAAVGLGIDAKTIPYVLKMADFSQVVDKEGKINEEALSGALNKVLEDVPGLKPQTTTASGFVKVGVDGNKATQQQTNHTQSNVPTKRWNRFN